VDATAGTALVAARGAGAAWAAFTAFVEAALATAQEFQLLEERLLMFTA
jgi:hypothetical protein